MQETLDITGFLLKASPRKTKTLKNRAEMCYNKDMNNQMSMSFFARRIERSQHEQESIAGTDRADYAVGRAGAADQAVLLRGEVRK